VDLARANAVRLGLDVAITEASLLVNAPDGLAAIVANPPYVTEGERSMLAPEITRHEPDLALFAGADGLNVIRPLLTEAAATTARLVALEVGAGQAPAVRGLMVACGFPEVEVILDLAGIERVVVGRR
jgi:release factor glutamine methyltransferase